MSPQKHSAPPVSAPDLSEEEEDARWDALLEATAERLRELGEEARAAYEAGQTVEMDFEDDYLGLGKDPEDL